MKCPHCNAEITDPTRVCPYCGELPPQTGQTGTSQPYYTQTIAQAVSQAASQTNTQPNAQPTAQPNTRQAAQSTAQPYYYSAPAGYSAASVQSGKSGGEIAAIVIAVIVSIISVIMAFVIFVVYAERITETGYNDLYDDDGTASDYFSDYYGMDGFDDEDSWDSFLDYYNSILGGDATYTSESPAEEHTPIEFQDYIYSFSSGSIDTTYTVELDEAYRGEAALKLLEGATVPNTQSGEEIYLAKFKLTIKEQETDAYVTVSPSIFTAAFNGEEEGTVGEQYESLRSIDYKDKNQLLKTGDEGYCWMAFVVKQSDERPLIMWDKYEGEYFRYSKAAVSAASGLEAGGALEAN